MEGVTELTSQAWVGMLGSGKQLEVGQSLTSTELPCLGTDSVGAVGEVGCTTQKAVRNRDCSLSDKALNVLYKPELPGSAQG